MRMLIILIAIAISSLAFGQKGYQKMSSSDQMVEKLKGSNAVYIQSLIDVTNPNDPALPVLKALLLEKQKKQTILKKKSGNSGSDKKVNTGLGNNNSASGNSKTDSLLLVVLKKVDGLDSRMSNVEMRLTNIEDQLAESDQKIDVLVEQIVKLGLSIEKAEKSSFNDYLEKGKLMIFDSGFLALTSNDEVLNDFSRQMSDLLKIDINPLWFDKYRKGEISEDSKNVLEKIIKLVGSVDSSDPEIVWKYLIEDSKENAGLIRQTFQKF